MTSEDRNRSTLQSDLNDARQIQESAPHARESGASDRVAKMTPDQVRNGAEPDELDQAPDDDAAAEDAPAGFGQSGPVPVASDPETYQGWPPPPGIVPEGERSER